MLRTSVFKNSNANNQIKNRRSQLTAPEFIFKYNKLLLTAGNHDG